MKNALQRDGLDPSIMELDPDKSIASQQNQEEKLVDKGPPLKDDPVYAKYFKVWSLSKVTCSASNETHPTLHCSVAKMMKMVSNIPIRYMVNVFLALCAYNFTLLFPLLRCVGSTQRSSAKCNAT